MIEMERIEPGSAAIRGLPKRRAAKRQLDTVIHGGENAGITGEGILHPDGCHCATNQGRYLRGRPRRAAIGRLVDRTVGGSILAAPPDTGANEAARFIEKESASDRPAEVRDAAPCVRLLRVRDTSCDEYRCKKLDQTKAANPATKRRNHCLRLSTQRSPPAPGRAPTLDMISALRT